MVAETPTIARPDATAGHRTLPGNRILGLAGMLGSPFLFLSFAANGFAQGDSNRPGAALGLLFSLGWIASILGLRNLDAAGRLSWLVGSSACSSGSLRCSMVSVVQPT